MGIEFVCSKTKRKNLILHAYICKINDYLGHFIAILLLIVSSVGISLFLIPKIVQLSSDLSLLDSAGRRKRHEGEIPNMGGVAIYLSFIFAYFIFFNPSLITGFWWIPVAFSILFFTGIYDDIKPMNASKKFIFQILAASILVYLADTHFVFFFTYFGLPAYAIKLLSVVFIVFVINAYNLIDGINGLSAMLALVALLGLSIWFFGVGRFAYAYLIFVIIGAIIAFLRFNLFKTIIFLGDNGSMILGLLVVFLVMKFVHINTELSGFNPYKVLAPVGIAIAAMAIPFYDTLRLFIIRPFYLQKSPFKADRNHLHHFLLRLGFSHIQSTFTLSTVAAFLLIFSFLAQGLGNTGVIAIVFMVCTALLVTLDYFIFNFYRRGVKKKTVFNEARRLRDELGNPIIFEFFFGLSFFILAIAIPFHRVSSSIPTLLILLSFLALLIRNFIVHKGSFKEVFLSELKNFGQHIYSKIILLFIGFYFLHLLIFQHGGWNSFSIKLLLLLYWLTIFHLEKIIKIKPKFLMVAFVYGCFGFSFFILYHSFIQFNKIGWDAFFYVELLNYVKANPITHSLYFNLAIVFLGYNFKSIKQNLWKLVNVIMLATFILMVILCGSKLGYLILIFTLIFAFWKMFSSLKLKLVALLGIVFIFTISFFTIDNVNKKIKGFKWQIERHDKISIDQKLPRTVIWPLAKEAIQENWILGVGVGNATNVLIEKYKTIDYQKGIENKFNAHNQFLETFLQTGIIGLLILIAIFMYGFYLALKHKNGLYAMFLVVILMYMMIESLFETQMGMVAFAFFNALFISFLNEKTNKKISTD